MIAAADRIRLADGVTFDGSALADAVRGASWPLNDSASFVLAQEGRPLAETVRDLSRAFSISGEAARDDTLRFVWQLNALALVNVEPAGSRLRRLHEWVQLAARLAPSGSVPAALSRRRHLETSTVRRAVVTCLLAMLPRALVIAVVALLLTAQAAAIAGAGGAVVPLVVGLATGAGLAVHEAAHAACLRGVPAALVTRGRRTYVLHAAVAPGRRAAVALGGPLAAALVGVACVAVGAVVALPVLALGGCPFVAHALGLTVVSSDGRVACGL